jgi:large subunit ribosomal protein L20
MPRSNNAVASQARRKKVLKASKGAWGAKHKLFKTAKENLQHAMLYAYRDRRTKKREFRKLWTMRISAAVRPFGLSYSRFIHQLKINQIELNRKALAYLAVTDPKTFGEIVQSVKKS